MRQENKFIYLVIVAITVFFFSCTKSISDDALVKFEKRSFSKSFDSTNSKTENYVHVKIDYVEFTEAKLPAVKDSLNNKVYRYINTPVFENNTKSLEELSLALIADYKSHKKEFPESPAVYELERKVEVINSTLEYVSIRFSEYSFLGGAHPNSVMLFSNIDLRTGKEIKLHDLFVDGYLAELNKIGESYFKKERGLHSDDDLEKVGFWFNENKFAVNNNFAISSDYLIFYFNDYEIAPHAIGPTEFKIPIKELKAIIKPGSFIKTNE